MEVLSHPPSGLPWRSDFERLRLTQPLPPSPPLARIRNLSTIPRACTEPTRYDAHLRSESEAADGEQRNQKSEKEGRRPVGAPSFPCSHPAQTHSSITARRPPGVAGTAPPFSAAGAGRGEPAAAATCPPEREALLECPPRPPAWARPCCLRRRRTAHSPCCSAAGGGGGGGGGFALADSPAPPLWCGPDACLWACVGRSP